MEIWHKRIKELRENSDVTLKDMAEIIGVSEATVQRYENGIIKELPYKAIIAYAKKFNVYPSYIMGWSSSPKQNTLFDMEHEYPTEKEVYELPQKSKEKTDTKLENLCDYIKNDDTLRKLLEVAVTCTEDDIEMVIKLLKYFRIRG